MSDINKYIRHLTEKQLDKIAEVVGEEAVDTARFYGGTNEVQFMQALFEETGIDGYRIIKAKED